ncbi:MAG: DVUA0089 family protein, partial [Saprospiraceae bacterium]|nr:DVUA0089 family protein [Saprospiraceae bacterium]
MNDLEKAFDDSGNCNVNTICSQGDNWRDQIKSVAMILVGGFRACTGYLVNNTAQDCRPLFLTANHCLGINDDAINSPNLNTWTFMWRYESPNCTPDTDGPTNMTTNGATLLANSATGGSITDSDFAILLLAESPKTAGYDVYFAGFDATTTAPSSATGIHHPSGDVKKISMENAALTGTSYGSTSGTATHWRVADWDSGTTEPGSSGSPIFSDATKRAMGFLSGGSAACGNDLPDWYGSLGYSWNNNGATDSRRRLRDHLDPGGLATFVDGSADPCASPCNTTVLFPGTLTTGDPTYNRVVGVGPPCTLSAVGTNVHYDAYSFTLVTAATVTVSIDPDDGASISPLNADTYLSLYGPGGFNPASPCTNILAVNDDIAGSSNRRSRIVTGTLAAGTYTAVLTSFDNVPVGGPLPWIYSLIVISPGLCEPTCPTFSGAPANVSIVNSSCGSGCTLTGGSISAPTGTPCPAGSTLQYNVNNTGWTTSLPIYDQDGPAQSIRTRCACDNDANNVSAESNPVSTIPGTLANPVVPANGSAIVACPALATQPTPPTVTGCDGSTITPTGPVISNSPDPVTCEGTRTYTWTYSCGGTSSTWSYVYTIERDPFTVPANGAATVNSPALAAQPTPPVVTSNCGEVLTPSGPAVTNNPDPIVCTGTRTYAWTYTDCEGNTAIWSFVYTIIDNTPPMVTCNNQTITFNGQESIALNANALVTASDNCDIQSITLSPSSITCEQLGQQVPVTVTASDGVNTATCTSTVTVAGLPCGWSQNPNGVNCNNGSNIAYNAGTGVWTATSTNCFYGPGFTSDAT